MAEQFSPSSENTDISEANQTNIIKVIGVGGGGNNAVSHMYKQNIKDVSFVVLNTDLQALKNSPVPTKLQIGSGLGAGNKPEVAREAAENDVEKIRELLDTRTKMVFITAGMGGGTGTGAAPVV
ncbi:MAG: cell division protein FtsZ, partial [Paramuribaculum sp.]|nr:cell division protein FtsZ [Paramuribaculum sp.]